MIKYLNHRLRLGARNPKFVVPGVIVVETTSCYVTRLLVDSRCKSCRELSLFNIVFYTLLNLLFLFILSLPTSRGISHGFSCLHFLANVFVISRWLAFCFCFGSFFNFTITLFTENHSIL